MTTQLITAHALTDEKGLNKNQHYLFSLQISDEGNIRIVTTNDIEIFYKTFHDFLISWKGISSLGWANDKETFEKMLDELKGMKK